MLKPEQNVKHKSIERHRSPSRTSQTVMLSLRTLRDTTQKIKPHKRFLSDTPLTTLIQIIDAMNVLQNSFNPLIGVHNETINLNRVFDLP